MGGRNRSLPILQKRVATEERTSANFFRTTLPFFSSFSLIVRGDMGRADTNGDIMPATVNWGRSSFYREA